MTYDLIIMGFIFQNKLVSQKQSSKSFHQISIFQVIDNSQEVIWDSSKILKSSNNNNNEKRKKLLNGGGGGGGGGGGVGAPQGFSKNNVRFSEYLFIKHFHLATSDALVL